MNTRLDFQSAFMPIFMASHMWDILHFCIPILLIPA
jgi:hypothetical protein